MPDTTDLYTTVKNTSGATRFFGYLGRRGRRLAAAATFSFYGQPVFKNVRQQEAFERDLLAGDISLVNTPRVILKDTSPDAPIATPSTQATAATTTGGSLAVGFYKFAYTCVNTWGETTVGTTLSAALEIPDATDDAAVITVPNPATITNCVSINVYATAMAASGGAVSAATLRKVGSVASGSTTLTLNSLPALDVSHPAPPTSNTTDAASAMALKLTDNTLGTADLSWGRFTE